MSTWYGYVCLSHEPPMEQDRVFHGYKGCEFLIWNLRRRRGQVQETTNYHDQNGTANAWLDEHPDCNVGVKDGYGETVYTYLKDKPLAQGGPISKGRAFAKEAGEAFIPYGENGPAKGKTVRLNVELTPQPHAVRQNDLVAALRKVAQAFPPHTETHHVLSLLARELVDPKDTSGYAYGRPVTPEQFEQAKGPEAPVPNGNCVKPHPWLPGIYCDRKPHNKTERHYSHPPEDQPHGTVINWVSK